MVCGRPVGFYMAIFLVAVLSSIASGCYRRGFAKVGIQDASLLVAVFS
jgi:hypothetical protein